jgi:NADH:ubiquinone oxidoreductase subunit F (NADH-binding)
VTAATLAPSGRLLAATTGEPDRSGLAGHLAVHGHLQVPQRDDARWRAALRAELVASGLLGRGGAGFPAAAKWDAVTRTGRRPLVVVNAMEGEPASHKDEALLAWSPHLVLDGAEVAAAAVGAREIVVCVPGDRDPAAAAVSRAIAERPSARRRASITVSRPPAGYVAGEESALAAWLDGRAGLPALRVDKSVPLRVRHRPLLLHNAETLAQVALVARHGAAWFRRLGTSEAPGSTLVTVSGAVRHPDVLEVELGTPVGEIVRRAGLTDRPGGLLLGGYGGAWLGPEHLSTPYAPGPLEAVGATLGVGIIVVLPAPSCGIAETARIVRYMAGQSAGQCGPCVFGLPAVAQDLERLWAGTVDPEVLGRIDRRAATITGRGACRHPDGVVRMVRSALAVFGDDARDHAAGRPCAGHVLPTVLRLPADHRAPVAS